MDQSPHSVTRNPPEDIADFTSDPTDTSNSSDTVTERVDHLYPRLFENAFSIGSIVNNEKKGREDEAKFKQISDTINDLISRVDDATSADATTKLKEALDYFTKHKQTKLDNYKAKAEGLVTALETYRLPADDPIQNAINALTSLNQERTSLIAFAKQNLESSDIPDKDKLSAALNTPAGREEVQENVKTYWTSVRNDQIESESLKSLVASFAKKLEECSARFSLIKFPDVEGGSNLKDALDNKNFQSQLENKAVIKIAENMLTAFSLVCVELFPKYVDGTQTLKDLIESCAEIIQTPGFHSSVQEWVKPDGSIDSLAHSTSLLMKEFIMICETAFQQVTQWKVKCSLNLERVFQISEINNDELGLKKNVLEQLNDLNEASFTVSLQLVPGILDSLVEVSLSLIQEAKNYKHLVSEVTTHALNFCETIENSRENPIWQNDSTLQLYLKHIPNTLDSEEAAKNVFTVANNILKTVEKLRRSSNLHETELTSEINGFKKGSKDLSKRVDSVARICQKLMTERAQLAYQCVDKGEHIQSLINMLLHTNKPWLTVFSSPTQIESAKQNIIQAAKRYRSSTSGCCRFPSGMKLKSLLYGEFNFNACCRCDTGFDVDLLNQKNHSAYAANVIVRSTLSVKTWCIKVPAYVKTSKKAKGKANITLSTTPTASTTFEWIKEQQDVFVLAMVELDIDCNEKRRLGQTVVEPSDEHSPHRRLVCKQCLQNYFEESEETGGTHANYWRAVKLEVQQLMLLSENARFDLKGTDLDVVRPKVGFIESKSEAPSLKDIADRIDKIIKDVNLENQTKANAVGTNDSGNPLPHTPGDQSSGQQPPTPPIYESGNLVPQSVVESLANTQPVPMSLLISESSAKLLSNPVIEEKSTTLTSELAQEYLG